VIVTFPDGTTVQATGIGRPDSDPDPDFALYLDEGWNHPSPAWDHLVLDWPDFGVPDNPDVARTAIRAAFERATEGERVEIGCLGGTGRTGTVLACMAILSGVPARDARGWVRTNCRPAAVETGVQHRFVSDFQERR
jgi:protein-tyrosine phosphatase